MDFDIFSTHVCPSQQQKFFVATQLWQTSPVRNGVIWSPSKKTRCRRPSLRHYPCPACSSVPGPMCAVRCPASGGINAIITLHFSRTCSDGRLKFRLTAWACLSRTVSINFTQFHTVHWTNFNFIRWIKTYKNPRIHMNSWIKTIKNI